MQGEVVVDQALRLQVDGLTVEGPFHVRSGHASGYARKINVHVPFGLYGCVEVTNGRGQTCKKRMMGSEFV